MKIVFTGGHHTAGLVVAKELIKLGHRVFWVGHRSSMIQVPAETAEYSEVKRSGIKFISLTSGKPVSYDPWWIVKLVFAFLRSLRLLLRTRPDLIFAWGGYLSVPVVSAGWLIGVPSIIHEQTRVTGRANRLLGFLAKKILVAWPDVEYDYPQGKILRVGLPLRPQIIAAKEKGRQGQQGQATILVIGGKQGSRVINEAVFVNLSSLLKLAKVIHQCGFANHNEDYQKAKRQLLSLPAEFRRRYQPTVYLDDQEIGSAYLEATLVIARAGAHTTAELLYLNKPALLVPLSLVPGQEQIRNAQLLKEVGLAETISQESLQAELVPAVKKMFKKITTYQVSDDRADQLLIKDPVNRILKVVRMFSSD